jgi:hypothetical protein
MQFWRNDTTSTFNCGTTASKHLTEILEAVRSGPQRTLADMTDVFFDSLGLVGGNGGGDWLVQEVGRLAGTLSVNVVFTKTERRVVGSRVAGGVSLWLEANGVMQAELSGYLHRLVCTNGMVRKVAVEARIEVSTIADWRGHLRATLPRVLDGVPVGFDRLDRSQQIRIGLLRPVVPVVLNGLGVREPYRQLVLDAFEAEPGDSLWHFGNAFSRAANLVMQAAGVPAAKAMEKRRRLQIATTQICEDALEHLAGGGSIIDLANAMRQELRLE